MESVTNIVVLPVAPERAEFDHQCYPCNCGAQPMLTQQGKSFYMSCSPCWVRTHKVESAELARLQWSYMMVPLQKIS